MSTLIVLGYPSEAEAKSAYQKILDLDKNLIVSLQSVAVVARRADGKYDVVTPGSKVGTSAVWGLFWGVLFGLLGKLNDKTAINAAASYLGSGVYQLYRHLYRAAGANEAYFALDPAACRLGMADADRKLSENTYTRALRNQAAQKAEFPDLSPEALSGAYPGRSQSLTQVLSAADARLNALSEQGR